MLELQEVTVVKGGRPILSIPHFQLHSGEVLGVMGPNGAGKSTLLKVAALLEEPSHGTVWLNGSQVGASRLPLEERRKLAVVLQKPLLFSGSVWKNLAIGLELRHVPKPIIKEKVQYWLERFHLAHLAKAQASHLSGGEVGRVTLARTMMLEPSILYLDEPFAALDYPTKVAIIKDLKKVLADTKTTTFFISHDLAEITFLADRLAVLIDGSVAQSGLTPDVLSNPNHQTSKFFEEWKLTSD